MADATCIVTTCQAPQSTRGYCRAHYLKVNRYGTPDARKSSATHPRTDEPLTVGRRTLICQHCGSGYTDGRRKYCSAACAQAAAGQTQSIRYHRLSNVDTKTMTATCSQCGPTNLWASNRGTTYGQYRCISGRRRDYLRRLNAKYGLTEEQVLALEAEADGKCMICTKPNDHLVIDHDHNTGHVRGLICDPCNVLLGRANDDIPTLLNAVQYLVERGTPARMALNPRG